MIQAWESGVTRKRKEPDFVKEPEFMRRPRLPQKSPNPQPIVVNVGYHELAPASSAWVLVGFFIPIIGLIVALVTDNGDGRVSKTIGGCLIWVLIGFVFALLGAGSAVGVFRDSRPILQFSNSTFSEVSEPLCSAACGSRR